MKALALSLVLYSSIGSTHELRLYSQHLDIRKQDETGEQHDVFARIKLNEKFDIGAQATYLERFNLFEQRIGGLFTWRPNPGTSLELRHFQGKDSEILPRRETDLIFYHSLNHGLSPYIIYKDAGYSLTRLHSLRLGVELEKWSGIILVPQLMYGKASFHGPSETKDVHNYGLRIIYYQERSWSLFAFTYKGTEASQTVTGQANEVLDTFSGGLGGGYYFTPQLSAELSVDHTDYGKLNNQFITTIFHLKWTSL